jgi:hypothetical protein
MQIYNHRDKGYHDAYISRVFIIKSHIIHNIDQVRVAENINYCNTSLPLNIRHHE